MLAGVRGFDLRGGWLLKMLPFHMDTLLIGAVLALALRGDEAERWQRWCKWLLIGAAGVLAALFCFAAGDYDRWMPTIGFTLIAMASAGLIGWTLDPGSAVARFFALQPFRVLGRYSYGFYVYHLLFAAGWAALTAALVRWLHSVLLGAAVGIAGQLAITFVVARLSYELFEARFLRWKRRFCL